VYELEDAIAIERRQIEEQVQTSSILADALKKRKEADEKPVA
jgi:GAF domain-containing protein